MVTCSQFPIAGGRPPQSCKSNIQMCLKGTFRARLLVTLYFQQFWIFSWNVQYPAIHYPSCLCMLCVRMSGQVQSRDPAGLSSLVQMLLCLPGLLGSDHSARPSLFLLCVRVSVNTCLCVRVFVGANKCEACQSCPEQPSFTPPERCGTKRPLSKWEKECVCVSECVYTFLMPY